MNQYPTILVSFKTVDATNFENAAAQLGMVLADLFRKHLYLLEDKKVDEDDVVKFKCIKSGTAQSPDMMDSLSMLARLMYEHYNKPVIILIDEYDVPMAKGDANGYYREITGIMRSMYNKALKDNPHIKLAVLTGCLKIAQESIFNGLNNIAVKTITDMDYNECFGFTNAEMDRLLADTGLMDKKAVFQEWYDGYLFGNREVYCPWDVLNYVDALQKTPDAKPANYWANTSGNEAIRKFLDSHFNVSDDFETLLRGGYVEKIINPNITYGELTENDTNLWSVLYMTGYLTIVPGSLYQDKSVDPSEIKGLYELPFKLKLPNKEIRILFEQTIARWFKETVMSDDRTELFKALWSGNTQGLSAIISRYLRSTISYYDYSEQFYHAFLAGLLSGTKGISVKSNHESGEGRADIIIKNEYDNLAVVLEFKVANSPADAVVKCDQAIQQITDRGYAVPLVEDEGYEVISYGIAFYKKRCFVKKADGTIN